MKEVANKIPCWAEDKLYLMWVLLNNANTEKQHYFLDFFKYRDDFKHIRDVRGFVETVEQFGAKITDLDFDSTLFKDEEKRDHENFERDLLEESKEKKWEKSIKNILNNKFTLADFKSYLYDVDDNCLLYYIGFRLKLDQEKEKAFRKETNDYLDAFIEEKIYSEKQNIYTFEIHKRAGFGVIYEIYDSYGDHFVVDQEYKNIFAKQEFLFIHFFLALDRLGYLSVQNIELDDDTTHIGEKYKVRVQLLESFFQNTMREEEKKSKIEKQQAVTYKDGVLNFKNERIESVYCHRLQKVSAS